MSDSEDAFLKSGLTGKERPGGGDLAAESPEEPAPPRETISQPRLVMTEERELELAEREFAERHALQGAEKPWAGHWTPFPVDNLPEPCRRFVIAAAANVGCDESYIALPLLSALAGAVGNSRSIRLEENWEEPAVIWSAIVGEGGTLKSPALDMTLGALCREQRRDTKRYEQEMEEWREACAEWKQRRKEEKKKEDTGASTSVALEQPGCCEEKPVRPVCRMRVISKLSVEALEEVLVENPRGVLLYRDELAGWLASFDARRGGKGSDAADWLTTFNARALVERRSRGSRRMLDIPRAAVSVTGGIQPAVLRAALARGQAQEGFGARLLLSYPPRLDRKYKLQPMPQAVREEMAELIRKLRALEPDLDEAGEIAPRALPLMGQAKMGWTAFYRQFAFSQANHCGDAAAVYAKMECYAARLALIIQLVRAVSGEGSPEGVEIESIDASYFLTWWFAFEARRILALFAGCPNPDDPGPLVKWIADRGGRVTTRELQKNFRRYRPAGLAEAALTALVKEDYGRWQVRSTDGRSREEFYLTRFPEEEP